MTYITYGEYSFLTQPEPEPEQLIETFDHLFSGGNV